MNVSYLTSLTSLIEKIISNFAFLKKILSSTFLTWIVFLLMKRIQVLKKKDLKELIYKKTQTNNSIIMALEPLDYVPAFFIPTYLTQALYHEFSTPLNIFFKREYLYNPIDKGVISLDWTISHNRNIMHNDKVMIIVHGLSGGSDTPYIRDIVNGFMVNFSVVVIHARGINDTPLHTPTLYHAGFTEDIKIALNHIKENFNYKYRFLLGISMGANITYKLLANDRSFDQYLTGFINISNFFHQVAAMIVNQGSLTDFFLLQSKKGYLIKHKDMIKANLKVDVEKALCTTHLRDFDEETLTKMHGFVDTEDYYSKTESGPDIDKLKNIKTLILIAKDDPIVFLFPRDFNNILKSDNLICVHTAYGGHIGWYQGLYPERWFVNKCIAFCEELICQKSIILE